VFSSSFSEGDHNYVTVHNPNAKEDTRPARRRIHALETYDVMHNMLYYLYCNRVTFSTVLEEVDDTSPRACDVEDLYALAHRLDVEKLRLKALGFLEKTCTLKNISSRVFSKFASLYPEVDTVYSRFFRRNWEEIRKREEHAEYFEEVDKGCDWAETSRVFKRFRELVRDFNTFSE
jgi:hypothetical protein